MTVNGSVKGETDVRQERMVENGNKGSVLHVCVVGMYVSDNRHEKFRL